MAPRKPSQAKRAAGVDTPLTVVGLGASAGGLEALEEFLRAMPQTSAFAFVIVQHLDPGHPSLLCEILGRATRMRVVEAAEGMAVEAGTVYVIPPRHDLSLGKATLHVTAWLPPRTTHLPIDTFFASLAQRYGRRAVGIVLSGTGADGTLGCRAILDHGGRTLVQTPEDAAYGGMPSSAILAGNAGQVLSVHDMPEALMGGRPARGNALPEEQADALSAILTFLRQVTGHDFTQYKQSTILRRIERRMLLQQIDDQQGYADYLRQHPDEARQLFNELLINVTQFFRDSDAFTVLKEEVLAPLLAEKPDDYVFRVWVAGCASGEEAYSVAILLHELMERSGRSLALQFFATDLDEDAIVTARAGLYPPGIAADIGAGRLQRYFTQEEGGYRIRKEIREMIVFAVQNVIKDPPFTRLDLLCCRNLMIYLGPQLQNRLLPTFHYALRPGGVLFLSPSESVGGHTALFTALHRKWKFYRVNKASSSKSVTLSGNLSWVPERVNTPPDTSPKMVKEINVAELTRRMLLQDFVPASVVTDLQGNIIYIHGDTGNYLRPAPGQATLNVIDMAREGLKLDLRTAVQQAAQGGADTLGRDVAITGGQLTRAIRLSVRRLPEGQQGDLLLISFQEMPAQVPVASLQQPTDCDSAQVSARIQLLEHDLAYTRRNLQATIDELQDANEELSSANEEMQSTNEELQSSNEELETSREELQSVNEELVTVNTELQAKIEQLGDMQNDMKNLLDSINIGTIFLDAQLAIRRFTRDAVKIYRLIPKDVGRPLADITSYLDRKDLLVRAQEVLDTLIPYEVELCTTTGNWFLARLLPYRTLDNVIDGVVLTFHDINTRVANEQSVQAARDLAEAIVDTMIEPLLVLDERLHVVSASRSYYREFRTTAADTVDRTLYELGSRQWDIPALRTQLGTILEGDTSFDGFVVEHHFPSIGPRTITLNARRVTGKGARPHLILLAMQMQPPRS
ncbi:chemotaxis protein CheB [Pseudomonas sp. PDNC002]|uniref:chemotaxis protein CheB n=1 Tax=Pseudomonas sp. PDNC002 TaxID=2811422 RepID=UPI001F058C45|nr:chemotaxis protein CheB [Pseudomonas sp. PDNC002]